MLEISNIVGVSCLELCECLVMIAEIGIIYKMLLCIHAHRQINGKQSFINSFSRAEPVELCPWDQTNVVHAKRALRPPSVENSDNESSEGESDQR